MYPSGEKKVYSFNKHLWSSCDIMEYFFRSSIAVNRKKSLSLWGLHSRERNRSYTNNYNIYTHIYHSIMKLYNIFYGMYNFISILFNNIIKKLNCQVRGVGKRPSKVGWSEKVPPEKVLFWGKGAVTTGPEVRMGLALGSGIRKRGGWRGGRGAPIEPGGAQRGMGLSCNYLRNHWDV